MAQRVLPVKSHCSDRNQEAVISASNVEQIAFQFDRLCFNFKTNLDNEKNDRQKRPFPDLLDDYNGLCTDFTAICWRLVN